MKQKRIRILIPILTLSIFLAGLFIIQNTALASQVCKKYKEYKKDFKNHESKKAYFQIKDLKDKNPKLYEFYKYFYNLHKHDSDSQISQMSLKDQTIFETYEDYKGYKEYRYYKNQCNKDDDEESSTPAPAPAPFVCEEGGFDAIAERTFSSGTTVIPMDDKQAEPLEVYGFLYALNQEGVSYYRILQDGTAGDTLKTESFPEGGEYLGGPVIIEDAIPSSVATEFADVTQDVLTDAYTSDTVTISETAPKILLIRNPNSDYGKTGSVLTEMGILFTTATITEVGNDPDSVLSYDIIIDDGGGWGGEIPSSVQDEIKSLVDSGGEVIFTDTALYDFNVTFTDYLGMTWNGLRNTTTIPFSVNSRKETPGQSYESESLNLRIPSYGAIAYRPIPDPSNYSEVRLLLDSDSFSYIDWLEDPHVASYATPVFYFPYGNGVAAGFGLMMPEQSDQLKAILGNQLLTLRCRD